MLNPSLRSGHAPFRFLSEATAHRRPIVMLNEVPLPRCTPMCRRLQHDEALATIARAWQYPLKCAASNSR
jgi:hypothetical protein